MWKQRSTNLTTLQGDFHLLPDTDTMAVSNLIYGGDIMDGNAIFLGNGYAWHGLDEVIELVKTHHETKTIHRHNFVFFCLDIHLGFD